jgi:uncharacterized protein YndB with AHSA1/START domain
MAPALDLPAPHHYHCLVAESTDLTDLLVVAVSRGIDAPAHTVFEVLRDPKRHHEFDGSGMVGDSDAPPIAAVGDTFVMRMHNDEFGDYEMRNEVVEFVPDRSIAWAPKRHDVDDDEDWNHRWGWQLTPQGEVTEVTAFYDCSRVPEDGLRILRRGEWGRPILDRSLEKLRELIVPR